MATTVTFIPSPGSEEYPNEELLLDNIPAHLIDCTTMQIKETKVIDGYAARFESDINPNDAILIGNGIRTGRNLDHRVYLFQRTTLKLSSSRKQV